MQIDIKNIILKGEKCNLVPFKEEMIPRYYKWLSDPEIQRLTGTEPINSMSEISDIYQMYSTESTKHIFIIVDLSLYSDTQEENIFYEMGDMAGDLNIFNYTDERGKYVELNIMIAENKSRRKGIAKYTLMMVICMLYEKLGVSRFVAHILKDNLGSLALFLGIGFVKVPEEKEYDEEIYELTIQNGNFPFPEAPNIFNSIRMLFCI